MLHMKYDILSLQHYDLSSLAAFYLTSLHWEASSPSGPNDPLTLDLCVTVLVCVCCYFHWCMSQMPSAQAALKILKEIISFNC